MEHINNKPEQVEIRRLQDNLTIVGSGVIIFSIWTAIKMMSSVFMLREETIAAFRDIYEMLDEIPDDILFYALIVMGGFIFLTDILLRTYVGLSAIREGQGKRRRRSIWYLVIAGIMVALSIISVITAFTSPDQQVMTAGAFANQTSFSSLLIELTSTVMLIEMMLAAVRIRKLRGAAKHKRKAKVTR